MLGIIFFYIPFINGLIFMIIGARMLGKRFANTVFRFIGVGNKSYPSIREALLANLKK